MKRKIAVFTGTRAEYGLLFWLMHDLQASDDFDLQVLVSGSHLSPEFGLTYKEIEQQGFSVSRKVEILLSSDTPVGVLKGLGLGLIGFADALEDMSTDALIILGDRFEALAAAQAAMLLGIPILHIHGGEITQGAYDDAIRHAITKLSYLHCTATDKYRDRVIQLGENPDRVFNFGAIGLDHLKRSQLISREELSADLNFDLSEKYLLVTYHPATFASEDPEISFNAIISALEDYSEFKIIFTYPNADEGGRKIISIIEGYVAANSERAIAIKSMGQIRYLSALKYASAVLGNSSSAIIEAPSFYLPSINIGERQKGRIYASSVLHCAADAKSISKTLMESQKKEHLDLCSNVVNPYGEGNVSNRLVRLLKSVDLKSRKIFYDMKVEG